MTRIYFSTPLTAHTSVDVPEAAAHHLAQVLRVREGDRLIAFDGLGGEYPAQIIAVAKRQVRVQLDAHDPISRESPLDLRLAQCVAKGERMDFVLQKAVELGITHITPILSTRSVVKLDDARWAKKQQHWQGVIESACAQSGRTRVPSLDAPQPLAQWLSSADFGLGITLEPTAEHSLATLPAPLGALTLLVGPEGGLAAHEISAAQHAGFVGMRVGPRILRTETAALAALAALQARYGDWT